MPINNPSFATSENFGTAQQWRIEMVQYQPDLSPAYVIDPPDLPNRIYGWYNGMSDMVELFMTNSAGTGYVRMTSTSG